MKAVSLFSGQGGLDIGAEDAGYDVLHAIEFNAFACETLRENRLIANLAPSDFGHWFDGLMDQRCYRAWSEADRKLLRDRLQRGVGKSSHFRTTNVIEDDIRRVQPEALLEQSGLRPGDLDLIIGGPPCQTFSRSGKGQSVNDERGQLFLDFVRFVQAMRPRWFLLENVKGITLTKTDVARASCAACSHIWQPAFSDYLDFRDSGNAPACPACASRDVAVAITPDVRGGAADIIVNEFERAGYRCHVAILNAAHFGAPQSRERFFIVGSRDNEPFSFPRATHGAEATQGSLFGGLLPIKTVWDTLFAEPNPYHHPAIDPDRAVLWVKNVVRPHDEPVTWSLHRPAPTVGAHQSAKLAIAPFGVPEEQLFRQQWHTLGRRQGDTKPVKVEHTYLSDEDLLRLQTFPDYWFVAGTRMERAFQIGNAVPPVLGGAVCGAIAVASGLKQAA